MARIKVTVRAESPLSLGTTKAYSGTLIETGRYIAGAQLRGALGALTRYVSEEEKKELNQILGTDQRSGINFPNCYLTDDPALLSCPTPLTAQTCKRAPGLKSENKQKDISHGVADTLLRQLAYDRVARDEKGRWRVPLPFQYKCPECGHRTETYAQIIEAHGEGHYNKPLLSSHRQTRVAINRTRLTAEEGLLYSVRAIDEGSLFVGLLEVDSERKALAEKWLQQITRIGGRTSRGFGQVKTTLEAPPTENSLYMRLLEFNDKYREFEADLCAIAEDPPQPDTRILFTINMRSDTLLRDGLGLPTLRFDETMLRSALEALLTEEERQVLEGIELRHIAQFALPQHVSGWQTAWQLPKEVLLAAQMGGLYVFAAEVGQEKSELEQLIEWLSRLEAVGIGEMREDGFGEIVICDPFHLEVKPV